MDNTRLFLFAALVFVGMLLWQQWQADYGPQPVASSDNQVGNTASGTGTGQQAVVDDLPDLAEGISQDSSQGGQGGAAGTTSNTEMQQLVSVETDVFQVLIDTRGGVIRSLKLKQYPISLEQPDEGLELVHSKSDEIYILQSGLRNKQSTAPTHHSLYRVEQTEYRLEAGQDELIVPLYWSQDGIEVVKSYHFRPGDYLIDVNHRVRNQSQQDWQGSEYRQIQRSPPPGNVTFALYLYRIGLLQRRNQVRKGHVRRYGRLAIETGVDRWLDCDDSALLPVRLGAAAGRNQPGLQHRQYPAKPVHLHHRTAFWKQGGRSGRKR